MHARAIRHQMYYVDHLRKILSECSGDIIEVVASKIHDKQYHIEDLSPRGRDKRAAISETTFSNALS